MERGGQVKTYYKVVAEVNGKLYSAMMAHIKEVGVEYGVGTWSKPTISGSVLYCFASLKRAREYIRDLNEKNTKFRIFRCKIKNESLCDADVSAYLDTKSILHFWGFEPSAPNLYSVGKIFNCVVADEVMLTKEVKL